jgi:hypothetical protein
MLSLSDATVWQVHVCWLACKTGLPLRTSVVVTYKCPGSVLSQSTLSVPYAGLLLATVAVAAAAMYVVSWLRGAEHGRY